MAVTVTLLRNVFTHMYLTYSLGALSFSEFKNNPSKFFLHYSRNSEYTYAMFSFWSGNLHLYDDGPFRNLQVLNDSSLKFLHIPSFGCQQNFILNSRGSEMHIDSLRRNSVKLFVIDNADNRYYLRLNSKNGSSVELVCQQYAETVRDNYSNYYNRDNNYIIIIMY